MPTEPCLVVFDVDGTLVDTELSIIEGFVAGFEAAGLVAPTAAAIRRTVGLSMEIAVARLLPGADAGLIERVAHLSREAVWALRQQPDYAEPLYPGALAAIEGLSSRGIVLAVATGKGRRGLRLFLERHGLAGRFMATQTADDAASKPAPDMLLNILAETGIDRRRAVMVGDTTFDMTMAGAAHMAAVGVSWGYHAPEELEAAGAARVLDGFAELVPYVAELFAFED
jgi:phosphoglycolate phosphatase